MHKFAVLIPTFNRSKELAKILQTLREEAIRERFRVKVMVVDDSSDWRFHHYLDIIQRVQHAEFFEIVYRRNNPNNGRALFWRTWNESLRLLKKWEFGQFIAIPDDHLPCPNFLARVYKEFNACRKKSPEIVAMNLLVNYHMCWQTNRFVDGAFIATRGFFRALDWKVKAVESERKEAWAKRRAISTGVGQQMTERLGAHPKFCIAKTTSKSKTWLLEMAVESVMFPLDKFPGRRAWSKLNNYVGSG